MNGAHIHLLLNHVPILGSLFALCLLLYGIFIKSEPVIKAALLTMVIASLISIPTFLSGEEAEHVVEPINAVNDEALEKHEDIAEVSFWVMLMGGAIALGTLFATRGGRAVSGTLAWINVVFMLGVFILMGRTGLSGGEIRHTEINTPVVSNEAEQD